MVRGIRRFISVAIVVCATAVISPASAPRHVPSTNIEAGNPQAAAGTLEVRIRRLHLVRPDLIPYPIAYEIVC